jgi:Acyl-CoA reductase (LuxC)
MPFDLDGLDPNRKANLEMDFTRDLPMNQTALSSVIVFAPHTDRDLDRFIEQTAIVSYISPCHDDLIESLSRLSKVILAHPRLKQDAASVALAYWLRKANLQRLKQEFTANCEALAKAVVVPVGQVFHLAPANVDTLFVYSWALAFICGNYNVVRISERQSSIVTDLLECFNQLMDEDLLLRDRNRFITYPHEAAITELLSAWCNHRVIWGGDETVRAIRAVPLNTHSSERVFSSKFSYAVLDIAAVLALPDPGMVQLASQFFNDMFVFNQMACSSPHIAFWIGDRAAAPDAIARFNQALSAVIARREAPDAIADAVKRFNASAHRAIDESVTVDWQYPGFISLYQQDGNVSKAASGSGVLTHCPITTLDAVVQIADRQDQTITYFGLSTEQIHVLALQAGARGVDRIVPIGEALAFSPDWDGFSLIDDFMRRVVIK